MSGLQARGPAAKPDVAVPPAAIPSVLLVTP